MPTILTIPRDTFTPSVPDAYEYAARHGAPVDDYLRLHALNELLRGDETMCWYCLFQAELYESPAACLKNNPRK